ncbi:ABC transporter, partial [Rhizobium ruizarguesonis]
IDLLKELQRELVLSYIFISHDLSVVEAIFDEIVVMYGGRKVEEITSLTVKAPQHPYSQLLFSSLPLADLVPWCPGFSTRPDRVSAVSGKRA